MQVKEYFTTKTRRASRQPIEERNPLFVLSALLQHGIELESDPEWEDRLVRAIMDHDEGEVVREGNEPLTFSWCWGSLPGALYLECVTVQGTSRLAEVEYA